MARRPHRLIVLAVAPDRRVVLHSTGDRATITAVDAVARLLLLARRYQLGVAPVHVDPRLERLFDLAGLTALLSPSAAGRSASPELCREAKQRKDPTRIEECVDTGDLGTRDLDDLE